MKQGIHPKLYTNAKVTDLSSSKTFTLASTKEDLHVEVTNLTHPFYTGKQKIVDTENLIKKFEERRNSKNSSAITKKKEKKQRRSSKTTAINTGEKLTLKDMLKNMS